MSAKSFWIDVAGHVNAGCHDVNHMSRLMFQTPVPRRIDAGGPMHDQWRGNSAFVGKMFVFPKRGVGDVGPSTAVADEGILRAGHRTRPCFERPSIAGLHGRPDLSLQIVGAHHFQVGRIAVLGRIAAVAFGTSSVVLQKEDERVVQLALMFQLLDNATDTLVHRINHGRVDFHVASFPRLVLHLVPVVGLR